MDVEELKYLILLGLVKVKELNSFKFKLIKFEIDYIFEQIYFIFFLLKHKVI